MSTNLPDQECGCYRCQEALAEQEATDMPAGLSLRMNRMFLCAQCGNKRCPHATDHRLVCTGSNEPGQPGSNYGPAL